MSEGLACYWCAHPDVRLGHPCPGCRMQLEVLVPAGRTFLRDLYVNVYKEMVLAEDHRVLTSICEEPT